MPDPSDLVDAEALCTAYPVKETTIRAWAARGHLTRYPQGHRKRTLYSLSEFARVFTEKSTERPANGERGVSH